MSSLPLLPCLRSLELEASERGTGGVLQAQHIPKDMEEVAKTFGKWLKRRNTAGHPGLKTLELGQCMKSHFELALPNFAEHANRTIYHYCQCAYGT